MKLIMAVDGFGTCATAAGTVAKVVTISGYTPAEGDLVAVKYTSGNSASSPTLNINDGGAKAIKLGGQNPTGASGTGAAYCSANGVVVYLWDGTAYNQLGSNDATDADTTTVYNVVENASMYKVTDPTIGGTQVYNPFIGICEDGAIEKITATSSATAAGSRTFATKALKLFSPVHFASATTVAWSAGSSFGVPLARKYSLGASLWKNAIGQYYNLAGTLVGNDVTADLVQCDMFVGGTLVGTDMFRPYEFSLKPRNGNYVYKRIGRFYTVGSLALELEQPAYVYAAGRWVEYVAGGTLVKVDTVPTTGKEGIVYYMTD
jgi:hypothetical protein